MEKYIDLRSDTVTNPSNKMLKFMAETSKNYLGDDVFGEDATVNLLEKKLAEYFNMEAGLFCPTGTMSNQIAIKGHTLPGQEVICDQNSHVYINEVGGIAFHSNCSIKPLEGKNGILTAEQIAKAIQPNDIHRPTTSLVVLENTHNRGGGSCYNLTELQKIGQLCQDHKIPLHLDGARLFNAIVCQNENPKNYGKICNSISICFSKGLGAPIGSILLGSKNFISSARKLRKLFGGGMRQVGTIASGALFAFQNNINRLKIDHDNTLTIAKILQTKKQIKSLLPVQTNILIFELNEKYFSAKRFCDFLKSKNILAFPVNLQSVRFVFHLDLNSTKIKYLISILKDL